MTGLLLAGCQTYAERPLDPEAHRAEWHARRAEAEFLAPFVEQLALDLTGDGREFDATDGIDLAEARLVALVFNPALRLARLRVQRAHAGDAHAGLWADPQISFNALRITDSIPDPWLINAGLGLSLPWSGRLEAERDQASAELQATRAAALESEWALWLGVEEGWIDWSATSLRAQVGQDFVDALQTLVPRIARLAGDGEVPPGEAALFQLELAQRSNELHGLRGEAQALEQRLRALLGLAPDAPLQLIGGLPGLDEGPRALSLEELRERNPTLARLRQRYRVAEETVRLEIKRQYPDLQLGPLVESDEGQWKLGLSGTIPLPFFNANRRRIAEARADRELARAALETALETLAGRWEVARTRRASVTAQRLDLERNLVPLIDRQLGDALQLLELGEGSALVLLESLTRAHRTKLNLIDTRSAEAHLQAELNFLAGPPVPSPGESPDESFNRSIESAETPEPTR